MASASFSIPRECISKDAIDLPKDLETALRGSAPSSSWYSCELLPSGELRDAHMCPQPGSSDSFYLSVPRGLPEVLLRPDLPGIIIAERRGQQVLTIMPLPAAPPTAASAAAAAGSTAAGGAAAGGADACTGAVATAERRGKRKHSSSPAQRPAMPRASDEAQQVGAVLLYLHQRLVRHHLTSTTHAAVFALIDAGTESPQTLCNAMQYMVIQQDIEGNKSRIHLRRASSGGAAPAAAASAAALPAYVPNLCCYFAAKISKQQWRRARSRPSRRPPQQVLSSGAVLFHK